MRRAAIVFLTLVLLWGGSLRLARAQGPLTPLAVLQRIDMEALHPRAYHPHIGDLFQIYLRYPVVPEDMVDNLDVTLHGRSVAIVAVADTTTGNLLGTEEISLFVAAKDLGLSHLEVTPMREGALTNKTYLINFFVEQRPKPAVRPEMARDVFEIKVSRAGGSEFLFFDPRMPSAELPVKVTFFNRGQATLHFHPSEYFFAFLDAQGSQLQDVLMVAPVARDIEVPAGQARDDKPMLRVSTTPLKDGQEYYFLATIRGRAGIVKLRAKALSVPPE